LTDTSQASAGGLCTYRDAPLKHTFNVRAAAVHDVTAKDHHRILIHRSHCEVPDVDRFPHSCALHPLAGVSICTPTHMNMLSEKDNAIIVLHCSRHSTKSAVTQGPWITSNCRLRVWLQFTSNCTYSSRCLCLRPLPTHSRYSYRL